MNHLVAHAEQGTLLFHDWVEAYGLWTRILEGIPGVLALCLMPNHIHVLHARATIADIRPCLVGFARWRNSRRGESGPVWESPMPPAEVVGGREKTRRNERYVHLNPPRGRLVSDPLGWAFSTHRDAVGLAAFPVRRPVSDPHEYHRYVSSDPHVSVTGTLLPTAPFLDPATADVVAAVSAVTRMPASLMEKRGSVRTLLARSLRRLTTAGLAEIGELTSLSRRQLSRVSSGPDRAVEGVRAVLGDRRFPALLDEDLQRQWRGWNRDVWRDLPPSSW